MTGGTGVIPTATPTASPTVPPATPTPTPTPSVGGSWTVVASPNVGPGSNILRGVAVVSATDAWAVGSSGAQTLILRWDGASWNVVASPSPGSQSNRLYGVVALGPNDVWAVGDTSDVNGTRTLALHWDGAAWRVVPTPSQPLVSATLFAVAAVSANDIWAVGGETGSSPPSGRAVFLHWDGSAWASVPAPPETADWSSSIRYGVAAVTSDDVWAVGEYSSMRWDGTRWVVVPGGQGVVAAAAAGPNDLWAVGSQTDYDGYEDHGPYTIVQYWNGTLWRQSPSANSTEKDELAGVTAIAPNDVWAVGGADGNTLVEHWNGTSWAVVPSANAVPATLGNSLVAVAATSPNDLWAVGFHLTSSGYAQTLILRYTAP